MLSALAISCIGGCALPQRLREMRGDSLGGAAVPELGHAPALAPLTHHLCRLYGMRGGTDLEIDIRAWKAKVLEQSVVQQRVVMLPRMDEHRRGQARMVAEGAQQRRHLHVV